MREGAGRPAREAKKHTTIATVRVLLTRLSALGDIVHTWPLAEELGRISGVELAWLIEEPYLPLAAGHPSVARTIAVATRRWRRAPFAAATRAELRECIGEIRAFAPELVIDPQGLWKSAIWGVLARAPRRVGLPWSLRREALCGLLYTETARQDCDGSHVVDINLSLLGALAITPPRGTIPDGSFLVRTADKPDWLPSRAVALLPATSRRGKSWPLERFAALAPRLHASGYRPVVLWGPGEEPLARRVGEAAGAPTVVAPPTGIVELAVTLHHCAAAVGGDTGPTHLAASVGTPTVAVMLATDPARNAPRGRHVEVVSGATSGATRGRARTRPTATVEVADVVDAVIRLLNRRRLDG